MNKLIDHPTRHEVHLFCEKDDSSQELIDDKHRAACASVCYGDSSRATDVLDALETTGATTVVLSIDTRDKITCKSDLCTPRAWAVVSAMKMPGMDHVRAIVLSSIGAGSSRIKYGRMGYGRLIARRRKLSLEDRTGQESAFLINGLDDRTVIIRTTDLTDGKATGDVIEFGATDRAPSFSIDSADVALYVTQEICRGLVQGKIVNITGRLPE